MKRRIILILTIAAVACVAAGGVWLYLRRHSKPRMRAQIGVEIRARHFDEALELANEYVQRYPDDWRGYHARADAYAFQGRYDEARRDLQKLLSEADWLKAADKVSVTLMLANTYSLPARRALAAADPSLDTLADCITQIGRANRILSALVPESQPGGPDNRILDLLEAIGVDQSQLGLAYLKKSARLAREAEIAKAAGAEDVRQAREKESRDDLAGSDAANAQAIQTLLGVVKADPAREKATQTLVSLCVERGDQDSLVAAQDAILGLKNPPPLATMMLIKHQLQASRRGGNAEDHRKKLQEACQKLDQVLTRPDLRPDESTQLKLARAELALESGDFPVADRLINNEILQANPRQGEARFMRARLLMERGSYEQAERELFALKTDFPAFIGAHLLYAQAAERSGKTDMVREAMRAVTRIEPRNTIEQGYVAAARRYLVGSLLREGIYNQAFLDAQEYYRQSPDDPFAVRLFVGTAVRTNQDYLAKEVLAKAVKEHADDPVMLIGVSEGYELVGDKAAARDVARKAADCKPDAPERRIAVARAMTAVGRTPEAERLLNEELARDWQQPGVHFVLGQIYWSTGRQMQALEQYRAAVQLDERNEEHKLALARRLFEMGDLDACQTILDQSDRSTAGVKLLAARIKLIRGEPVGEETALEAAGGEAVTMAVDYLRMGQPERAVEICLNELKSDKAPDNLDARTVLAQAYAALGQQDKSVEQLTEVVKAAPDQIPGYMALATALGRSNPPDQVVAALSKVPGAKRPMVDMTAGWLLARLGLYGRAAEAFGKVVDNREAREYDRSLARLYRAAAQTRLGRWQLAMADLDTLTAKETWRRQALLAKAELLLSLRRPSEAEPVISQMRSMATEARDVQWLRGLVMLYAQAGAFDKAAVICDDVIKLRPNDARSHLTKATVLEGAGRASEAIDAYKQAVSLQPENFGIYRRLAGAYDAQGRPAEALAVLEQLATISKLGQEAALWEKGSLLAVWGLQEAAAECFQRLSETGKSTNPQIQLGLGKALARLGRKDAAQAALGKIPQYAQAYVTAQELLTQLADTTDAKLQVLRDARKAKADAESLMVIEMAVLMRAERAAEAVKVYRAFADAQPAGHALAPETHHLAVQAMLQAGQKKQAGELCGRQADRTRLARWRQLAALLLADEDLPAAAKMLPEPPQADFTDAVLGVALSFQAGDDKRAGEWAGRIEQIEGELGQQSPPQAVPPSYGLLAALASGAKERAAEKLRKLTRLEPLSRSVAEAMVARAEGAADVRSQAARLLKATAASDLGLPAQCRSWARELLQSDPFCQWAAMLIVQRTNPDEKTIQAVLDMLQPKDCLLARTIAALQMMRHKEYERACELYGKLAAAEKDNAAFLLFQAAAAESAGRLEEALELYRKVFQGSGDPAAANNAAYIIARLWPDDPARLGEAQTMIEAAVKVQPQVPSFRDTLGWIALLQGRTDDALRNLRQAIRGLSEAPEAHYHLGLAEAMAKQDQLARWHFAAAAGLGKRLTAEGAELSPGAAAAIKLAQEALNQMGPAEK
jgi:tetratricopeptide (TPR) repeat protein